MVVLIISTLQIKRSRLRFRTSLLELIRVLIVFAIIFMIGKPELIKPLPELNKPELWILEDVSKSMTTLDVVAKTGGLIPRHLAVSRVISGNLLNQLGKKFAIHRESFSGNPIDDDGTDIAIALNKTINSTGDPRAVLLLSDGDWNLGEDPLGASMLLKNKEISVFCASVGASSALPDIGLSKVHIPSYGLLKEKISIPFSVFSTLEKAEDIRVQLLINNSMVEERKVSIPSGEDAKGVLHWVPSMIGDHTVTIKCLVPEEDTIADNHKKEFKINIKNEILKVLIIESIPRWEYRFIRNALMRDPGVEVETVLFHENGMKMGEGEGYLEEPPSKIKDLIQYDVIFLGDVGVKHLKPKILTNIKSVIEEHASGLVFLPGPRGHQLSLSSTDIGNLLPIEYDQSNVLGNSSVLPLEMRLTPAGENHLLTLLSDVGRSNALLWDQLPGFHWNAPVKKVKLGSTILAIHSSLRNDHGPLPLLALSFPENGRVLFCGTDSVWRWRKGVEDKYHYRFWGQVVRWMSHKRHLVNEKGIRLMISPEKPEQGDEVNVQAILYDRAGYPIRASEINCEFKNDKSKVSFVLKPSDKNSELFEGSFVARDAGQFDLSLSCKDNGFLYIHKMLIEGTVNEKIGQPVNLKALNNISLVTGAKTLPIMKINELVASLESLPQRKSRVKRIQIWSHWGSASVLLIMCSLFWLFRKRAGLI